MNSLHIEGVTAGYDGVKILRNVSLEVPKGSMVCVMGRNGVGKTTLVKTVMGQLPTISGDIRWCGRGLNKRRPYEIAEMGIGYAPQEGGLFAELTVLENLKVGCRLKGAMFDGARDRVCEMFPILGQRLGQKAGTLSGGEKHMLLLARAVLEKPPLIVLDEISEGVQPSVIGKMAEVLSDLKRDGTTVLMVEQRLELVMEVADTCALMSSGEIASVISVGPDTRGVVERHLMI